MDGLERVQGRATKVIKGLGSQCQERLRELGSSAWRKEGLREFQY